MMRRRILSSHNLTLICVSVVLFILLASQPFEAFLRLSVPTSNNDSTSHRLSAAERAVFFDCQHPLAHCRYLEVGDLFQRLSEHYTDDDMKQFGANNPNLPAITTLEWLCDDDCQRVVGLPPLVSFVHVHKCGGTTIHAVLRQVRDNLLESGIQAQVSTFKYAMGPTRPDEKRINEQLRMDHIQSMKLVFSVLRDPVERFFSGLQQVMHYHDDLRAQCLHRTARATIQCALDFLAQHRPYLGDVHLLPMATHFRLLEKHTVAVFDHPSYVSRYFLNGTVWHQRDRSDAHTATSTILSTMAPTDCTPVMLQRICQMYKIDLMLRTSLGWEPSPWCNSDGLG